MLPPDETRRGVERSEALGGRTSGRSAAAACVRAASSVVLGLRGPKEPRARTRTCRASEVPRAGWRPARCRGGAVPLGVPIEVRRAGLEGSLSRALLLSRAAGGVAARMWRRASRATGAATTSGIGGFSNATRPGLLRWNLPEAGNLGEALVQRARGPGWGETARLPGSRHTWGVAAPPLVGQFGGGGGTCLHGGALTDGLDGRDGGILQALSAGGRSTPVAPGQAAGGHLTTSASSSGRNRPLQAEWPEGSAISSVGVALAIALDRRLSGVPRWERRAGTQPSQPKVPLPSHSPACASGCSSHLSPRVAMPGKSLALAHSRLALADCLAARQWMLPCPSPVGRTDPCRGVTWLSDSVDPKERPSHRHPHHRALELSAFRFLLSLFLSLC